MIASCLLLATLVLALGDDPAATASLPVTVQQCIYMAEKNSVPLRMSEIDVQIGKARVGSALGAFDTVAFFDATHTKAIRPTASAFERGDLGGLGGTTQTEVIVTGITTKTCRATGGFRGSLLTGASYSADFDWTKTKTSAGTFGGFNPEYRSGVGLALTQPLLRGFGTTVNKAQILAAQHNMIGAAETLEENRLLRAAQVISAYWEFYFANRYVETRAFLVEQAEKLVRINQKKLDVGDARRLDVIEAESDLANRQQALITAQNEIGRTQDELKRLIFPFDERSDWDVLLVPLTDAAEQEVSPPSWEEAALVALERRPELRKRREFLKNNDLDILVAENAVLPQLDLSASLRFNQLADSREDSDDISDDYYTIVAGFSFEMPIGNRTARYDLSIARLEKIKALLEYKDTENQVIQEVRNSVRDVANRLKEIVAAREAVRLASERWDAEQKRQEVGYSTTFQVRDAQAAWQEAKDAELRSLFSYQIALASLDAAQGTLLERYGILPAPRPRLDDRAGIHYDS